MTDLLELRRDAFNTYNDFARAVRYEADDDENPYAEVLPELDPEHVAVIQCTTQMLHDSMHPTYVPMSEIIIAIFVTETIMPSLIEQRPSLRFIATAASTTLRYLLRLEQKGLTFDA